MTYVVVPPLVDHTLEVAVEPGEQLIDLNQQLIDRLSGVDALRRLTERLDIRDLHRSRAAGRNCLLAHAALDALGAVESGAEPAGTMTALRAAAAAVRVSSTDDPGLTACIDDIRLREGTTGSSADVLRAAARCTLFDPEFAQLLTRLDLAQHERTIGVPLPRAAGLPPTAARPARQQLRSQQVELVVDVDQQLPAALRLVRELPGDRRSVTLSGRFVRDHLAALQALPMLADVRLEPRIRPRTLRGLVGADGVRWVTAGDDCPDQGTWAGWLEAGELGALSPALLRRCAGLVVTVPGWSGPIGPAWLAGLLPSLPTTSPVALEVLIRAETHPEEDPAERWLAVGPAVQLAGFRPLGPPAEPAPDQDLARPWAPADPATAARAGELASAIGWRCELFPGRLAAALFAPAHRPRLQPGYRWDAAVRLVHTEHLGPAGDDPGDFLVNLRTGSITRVQPALAGVLAELRQGGPAATRALAELPESRREQLLGRLCTARAVHAREAGV